MGKEQIADIKRPFTSGFCPTLTSLVSGLNRHYNTDSYIRLNDNAYQGYLPLLSILNHQS
jgi:hypothetical protein